MIVAYTLVPIVRQSISNHHADFSVFMMSCEIYEAIRITLQLSINYDRRRLEDGQPISSLLQVRLLTQRVVKFNGLPWRADSEFHVIHISHVIISYTLESLSSHT